ncbi:uncharacterized protein LOC131240716 isoform X2 [Magnolia sinica]|nr:uncharacterized protein LOC131240716 isoform X2 [Magnolia sinica]
MEPVSSSSASSLVSKAKTAFHSAAARAEKVLTDIKADLKHDREVEGDSHKAPKKLSEHECNVADKSRADECYNEFKRSRWKPPHLGIKQEWQHRLKNIKRGRKGFEEKERPESLTPDILALDEYLNHMDQGLEQGSIGVEDASIASNVVSVPPTSIIKQLAVALEAGKKFKSLKDLLASTRGSSPVKERSGLSFSAVKSLVLREKEEKPVPEPDDNEEVLSLIHSLFDACREEHIPKMENGSCSTIPTTMYLPRDIHGAPPESFVVRLSEIIGSLKSPQRMASFWYNVVAELRRLWSEGQPVPHVPLDEIPDLNYCLLHQRLQVINCCIARKRRRIISVESLDSVMKETNTNTEGSGVSVSNQSSSPIIYARTSTGDLVLRLGADHPSRSLTMLETDESVYSPVTQEGPILTEDLIRETEEFVLRTGSLGAGCSQLLSDMQAFKAANPGCILEDFVRWHSPPDWTEAKSDDETKDSFDGGEPSSRKGQLSSRMQKEGNLWRELWETARPLPAVKQTPLFDEDLAV